MDLGPYIGGHGPETDREKVERYAIDQCTGDVACQGGYHVHGCYAPHVASKCDSPESHDSGSDS